VKHLKNPRIYLLIITIAFVLHSLHFNFTCDDAFISFRYARNFINGHGLVWNIGEQPPVEGYTNFLWIITIGLFMKMGFEPVVVSKVLGIFFGLCCIPLLYLCSELVFQRKSFLNLIAPVILACCGPFAAWSIGGLETQMFTFFTLAAAVRYLYEVQHDNITPASAILFVLASLTRPEGILLFGITCLHRFFYLLVTKKAFSAERRSSGLSHFSFSTASIFTGDLTTMGLSFLIPFTQRQEVEYTNCKEVLDTLHTSLCSLNGQF
jgi:hypothetical protein